jgi:phage-related baseplate assembly protein
MDDTELHYLTYEPDEIMAAMMEAYAEAGGSVVRAGDEKEMLLRGVQSVIMQAFAGIDNALRMDTLRYAVGEYLDVYGEKRNCIRIQAKKAAATVTITKSATGVSVTIPAGSALTQDGQLLYVTDADVTLDGTAGTVSADITAEDAGAKGNSLQAGANMQFLNEFQGVVSVVCSAAASGGNDREEDEAYRERIRLYGLSAVTTGPSELYERLAREASSDVIDAKALHGDDLDVDIYLILKTGAVAATVKAAVAAACDPKSVRPLNDHVTVYEATNKTYTLVVQYSGPDTIDLDTAVAAAVDKYQAWQDNIIGQPFNPDMLKAYLYQAGCTLVTFGSGSSGIDGGNVEYTEIAASARCKGTITTAVIA